MNLTASLLHTTDKYIKALEKAWVTKVSDLINHYPRDYEDRTNVLDTFSYINLKEKNTILVTLVSLDTTRTWNGKILTKAVLEDKSWFMSEAVWFNKKYFGANVLASRWKKVLVSWKVKYEYWKVTFMSPDIETDLSKVEWEILPIYPDINYIPWTWIESKMLLLKSYFDEIKEVLPESIVEKYKFISRKDALLKLHFPKNKQDIEVAKFRLAYEELFEINFKTLSKKFESFKETEWKSLSIPLNADLIKDILSNLPFSLTNWQKVSLFQILKDMEKNHSMQRLLEGDVWTGKTVIALIVAIHAILESRKVLSPLLKRGLGGFSNSLSNNYIFENTKVDKKIFPYNHELKEKARELRNNMTEAEKKLWFNFLKNIEINILRQKPLLNYIVDFFIPSIWLVIEIDWDSHFEKDYIEYDNKRTKDLEDNWLKVLRFTNNEIYESFENVCEIISSEIKNHPTPLYERGHMEQNHPNPLYKEGIEYDSIQVALMVPTEILARQHFSSIQDLLLKYHLSSELLVWSTTVKEKESIKQKLQSWNVDIIVWTHALIQEDVIFNNLWFVIVDEQHRFWVKQREILESWLWNRSWLVPHNLNMTATPIPRTLALTLYWDQDLSVIKEYPAGRKTIYTKVARNDEERQQIELFVRNQIESGRQVFWISPLVEESEKIDLANAISTFESLQAIYEPFKVWLLHGKMKPKEKDAIMKEFSENKISILSSTSVVEVWVNIPNATIMCIEWAERFWLSQLHQFRWRVGRGEHQSYCYLFPSKWNYTDRLKAMEMTNNWFELAEIDLELRWPGEVYWVRQSWLPDLKIADLKDLELVSQIREDIENLFSWK